jgi:Ca2+/Na+ antiporter
MAARGVRLSRPLYEAVPWLYLLCGLFALAASYRHRGTGISVIAGIIGILAVIAGIVLLLRRRDFRELRAHYQDQPGSSSSSMDS